MNPELSSVIVSDICYIIDRFRDFAHDWLGWFYSKQSKIKFKHWLLFYIVGFRLLTDSTQ